MVGRLALLAALCVRPASALDPLFVASENRDLVEDLTSRYLPHLPPGMAAAWVHVESDWHKDAVSRRGARGVLQIMPTTAEQIRVSCRMPELDLTSIESTLKAGFCYGAQLRRELKPMASEADLDEAMFRAYNGGAGYIRRERERALADAREAGRAAEVAAYCREFRGEEACQENLSYYPKILDRYERSYQAWSTSRKPDPSPILRMTLGVVRGALEAYKKRYGSFPKSLQALVDKNLLPSIPSIAVPGRHPSSRAVTYQRYLDDGAAQDKGGWGYFSDRRYAGFGSVFVNCTHADRAGRNWDSY